MKEVKVVFEILEKDKYKKFKKNFKVTDNRGTDYEKKAKGGADASILLEIEKQIRSLFGDVEEIKIVYIDGLSSS